MVRRRKAGPGKKEVGLVLVTEAVNLCPEGDSSCGLHLTYGETVRLAQSSPRVAALLNWRKVRRFAVDEVKPRRQGLPQPPTTTFPLPSPRLPTRLSPTAIAVLSRRAELDDG
eukprot:CAMPEP_0118908264 /NCGR_PEP_ID=MMETSP1166-20130328/11355_1 /TAXON_ID=1104430 /ORGANISM="Chrysoreinhardia sp, Strain CCMP3193" /LENGTH=112 /DNA_ID=CAMNT_0006847655 /DNA_START=41 /DNA_END=375 /DNA_ORIENTATION=-